MKNQSLKEVVREMCSLVPGRRDAMAGSLGLSLTSFNNRFYEKNGCRFFDHHDLMVMQEVSGTVLYAEYVAAESGMLLVDSPKKSEIGRTDLYEKSVRASVMRGAVDLCISKAIEDGEITTGEADAIRTAHYRDMQARTDEVESTIILFTRAQKG